MIFFSFSKSEIPVVIETKDNFYMYAKATLKLSL